jgi:hypothetical protein
MAGSLGERITHLEISGVMDRHAAEALQLEARRLAKRYGIGFLEPKAHVHLVEQSDGKIEVPHPARVISGVAVERAEGQMAPGDQRAHTKLAGQREGLAIVACALHELRRLAPRQELAEEAERVRLVSMFLLLARARQRRLCQSEGVLQAARHEAGLSQPGQEDRLHVRQPERFSLLHRALEQRYGLRKAP